MNLFYKFNEWCRKNTLDLRTQLLFFKLLYLACENGLNEYFEVPNSELMSLCEIGNRMSFKRSRDKLIELGFIEYVKGKKDHPGKYKIKLENNEKDETQLEERKDSTKEYFELPKLVKIYVKDYPHLGYAVVGELEIGSEILLDFFFANKNSASMSMKYITENILKKNLVVER